MSIERKDLRIKLHPDDHTGLHLLAQADQVEMAEWAERVIARAVRRRIHDAMVVYKQAERLGIAGRAIPGDD